MGLAAFNRMRRIQAEAKEEAAKASKESVEDPELEALRAKGKELGVRNWHNMGREKLIEKIEEAEKENKLQEELLQLRIRAIELDIEDAENKDAETLTAEIAAKESEDKGGEGNGDRTD